MDDVLLSPKPLLFILLLLGLSNLQGFGQNDTTIKRDTVDKTMTLKEKQEQADTTDISSQEEEHSPKKATYYSMALPGLGQAYNKKYWKIPVIYTGFGTLIYFISTNTQEYNTFLDAYTYVLEEQEGPPPNDMVERYNSDLKKLRTIKDFYRRNMELSYILTGALYILQVLDATVDAHFVEFDVSEDLSLQVDPYFEPVAPLNKNAVMAAKGITIKLNL